MLIGVVPLGYVGVFLLAGKVPDPVLPMPVTLLGWAVGIAAWIFFSRYRKALAAGDGVLATSYRRWCVSIAALGSVLFILGFAGMNASDRRGALAPARGPAVTPTRSPESGRAPESARLPTPAELARFQEILRSAISNADTPSEESRRELWELLDQTGSAEPLATSLRASIGGPVMERNRLYWEDARCSIETGKACHSEKRRQVEAELLKQGVMKPEQISSQDLNLTRIADGKPIPVAAGGELVITRELIDQTLAGLDDAKRRVDLLFTRPAPPEQSGARGSK